MIDEVKKEKIEELISQHAYEFLSFYEKGNLSQSVEEFRENQKQYDIFVDNIIQKIVEVILYE